jgi:DNA-binding response OmpR family regulator
MKTILVVDDEPKIVQLARDYLEHAGFTVASASDGREALASFRANAPELIVLDLGLPLVDGLDVARAIRKTSNVPIVMLTGRGDEADRVAGLELGADDYVTKPFSPRSSLPVFAPCCAVPRSPPTRTMSSAPATSRSTSRGCASM